MALNFKEIRKPKEFSYNPSFLPIPNLQIITFNDILLTLFQNALIRPVVPIKVLICTLAHNRKYLSEKWQIDSFTVSYEIFSSLVVLWFDFEGLCWKNLGDT